MQEAMQGIQPASADFVSAYEKAMYDVVAACGSRSAANSMIGELQRHYEETAIALKHAGDSKERQEVILRTAKSEAGRIIEKYAPNTGSHFHEIVMSYSFGAIMLTMPLIAAASLLTVATGIIAVGSTYFISSKILGNWKCMVARRRMSDLSGLVGPKHVKSLPTILGAARKK
jgi:hypothetical protein